MEVCDLHECDFMETKFNECSETEYYTRNETKGIMKKKTIRQPAPTTSSLRADPPSPAPSVLQPGQPTLPGQFEMFRTK